MVSKGWINKGVVVAFGDEQDLFLNDVIFFKKHMAAEIKHEGKTYFVVKAEFVIAVM